MLTFLHIKYGRGTHKEIQFTKKDVGQKTKMVEGGATALKIFVKVLEKLSFVMWGMSKELGDTDVVPFILWASVVDWLSPVSSDNPSRHVLH